ncbi:OmpA family protein [uncultured Tateyamaria sp.]|uniref:OmpA family protein n=1 Tax=uncultured Tateyamaria sp. TaxID=455651 RepID=UPI002633B057|nr:OmpA family protein [uncultured Tateyamaria sp.]
MILKYVRDSLPWLVPSAAIAFAASGFLDRGNDTQVAETAPVPVYVAPAVQPAAVAAPASAPQAVSTQIAAAAPLVAQEEVVARQATGTDALGGLQPAVEPLTQPLAAAPAPAPAVPEQTTEERLAALTTTQPSTQFFTAGGAALQAKEQCMDDLRNLAGQARVYFPSGGLTADEGGIEQGRLLGLVAQSCPGVQIRVEGHSDPSGDPAANLRLSEARAQQVIQRIGAGGIDTSMFFAQGMGDQRPSGIVGPKPSSFYDRRVEFSIVEEVTRVAVRTPVAPKPWANASCVVELERAVQGTALFYAPRSVSLHADDLETALSLANLAMACPHARLRVVGHHSSDIQAREGFHTGLLRAKAVMAMLVGRGVAPEQIIIAAPSRALSGAGLPGSRVNFDVILEEG